MSSRWCTAPADGPRRALVASRRRQQLLRAPGLKVQRFFTTREPSEDQLDVAEKAMAELLRLEGVEPGATGVAEPVPAV